MHPTRRRRRRSERKVIDWLMLLVTVGWIAVSVLVTAWSVSDDIRHNRTDDVAATLILGGIGTLVCFGFPWIVVMALLLVVRNVMSGSEQEAPPTTVVVVNPPAERSDITFPGLPAPVENPIPKRRTAPARPRPRAVASSLPAEDAPQSAVTAARVRWKCRGCGRTYMIPANHKPGNRCPKCVRGS